MRLALASVAYDSPAKIENEQVATDIGMLATTGAQVRLLVAQAIQHAQRVGDRLALPDSRAGGRGGLGELRQRGVQVTLLTNSLAATDEPSVHLGYRKYRAALLREGVALYEWSPARGDRVLRELVAGGTVLRLHAKAALVDRERVFLGSMNFDPRSRDLNTEFGLLIRSPELAEELHALLMQLMRKAPTGCTWSRRPHAALDRRRQRLHHEAFEPDTDFGSRLLLDLLEPFVPEEML